MNVAKYVLGLVQLFAGFAAEREVLGVKEEMAQFSRESAEIAMETEEPTVPLVLGMAGAIWKKKSLKMHIVYVWPATAAEIFSAASA